MADAGAVALLAGELAQSFAISREKFDLTYPQLLTARDACLLLAADGEQCPRLLARLPASHLLRQRAGGLGRGNAGPE